MILLTTLSVSLRSYPCDYGRNGLNTALLQTTSIYNINFIIHFLALQKSQIEVDSCDKPRNGGQSFRVYIKHLKKDVR